MTRYEQEFYHNVDRIAKALEGIQTQLTNRSAEDCEKRTKIMNEMHQAEIQKLRRLFDDEGIELCSDCGEEIATDAGLCEDCQG
jgi:hypothetical protein